MAQFTSSYKQRAPLSRRMTGEDSYEKGMNWSNQALDVGYVHTIMNLELDNGTLKVSGGLHTTEAAAGCSFLDQKVFNDPTQGIITVVQKRNEYCQEAFEGITNIISAEKLSVKNNQDLVERTRIGYAPQDVVCYKVLTYNPFNNRLMVITMLQAERDKFFQISDDFTYRRIMVNPISTGSAELWGDYLTNKGVSDSIFPRTIRNSPLSTFGVTLHSPHYAKTIANATGYGDKTFMFTEGMFTGVEGNVYNSPAGAVLFGFGVEGLNVTCKQYRDYCSHIKIGATYNLLCSGHTLYNSATNPTGTMLRPAILRCTGQEQNDEGVLVYVFETLREPMFSARVLLSSILPSNTTWYIAELTPDPQSTDESVFIEAEYQCSPNEHLITLFPFPQPSKYIADINLEAAIDAASTELFLKDYRGNVEYLYYDRVIKQSGWSWYPG